MTQTLKKRLLKILTNSEDIDNELIETVAKEVLEIVGDKDIKQPLILDIAIYRYLLIKGTLALDAYEQSYKSAIKALDNAPIKRDDGKSNFVKVGKREQIWSY